MGLDIQVGYLSDIKRNDTEFFPEVKEQYSILSKYLKNNENLNYKEPDNISESDIFSCQLWGYAGLHHLRRYASYISLGLNPGYPINYNDVEDPIIDEYYKQMTDSSKNEKISFQHLMFHSDSEGYYLPIDFANVLLPEDLYKIPGNSIGSAYQLLKGCEEIAKSLDLPLDTDHESEEIWKNADEHPGAGKKWQDYGIESFTCIRLIRGCEASINLKSALTFC